MPDVDKQTWAVEYPSCATGLSVVAGGFHSKHGAEHFVRLLGSINKGPGVVVSENVKEKV